MTEWVNPAVIAATSAGVAGILTAAPGVIRAFRETPSGHESPRRLLDRLVAAIRHTTVWQEIDEVLKSDIDRELEQ